MEEPQGKIVSFSCCTDHYCTSQVCMASLSLVIVRVRKCSQYESIIINIRIQSHLINFMFTTCSYVAFLQYSQSNTSTIHILFVSGILIGRPPQSLRLERFKTEHVLDLPCYWHATLHCVYNVSSPFKCLEGKK